MPISIKTLRAFTDGIPWVKIFKKAENTMFEISVNSTLSRSICQSPTWSALVQIRIAVRPDHTNQCTLINYGKLLQFHY
ncbi:hypothetical protein PDIG_75950 [Penicillium digitatum PHI26]|uniref:Uncharacterized protein n=2 Tax=Penicillium digitatum TaxID=36651 RepID=K9FW61_PEND2|nr:hypothetical protein PDIP_46420 [Penicillium digitatum Pd1]EKV06928.1 hypothetical protein PDIG_75950 [Penicillium digitatum PHI26]EKV13858.1 hypothetical protein PDIP_46420 [Penicillium digitatum Pd1]